MPMSALLAFLQQAHQLAGAGLVQHQMHFRKRRLEGGDLRRGSA